MYLSDRARFDQDVFDRLAALDAIIESDETRQQKLDRCSELILTCDDLTADKKAELLLHASATVMMVGEPDDDLYERHFFTLRNQVLPELLGEERYAVLGREIARRLTSGREFCDEEVGSLSREEFPELAALDPLVRFEVVERYVDSGLLKRKTKDGTSVLKFSRTSSPRIMHSGRMQSSKTANEMIKKAEERDEADLELAYENHNKQRAVTQLDFFIDKDGYKVLPVNELRIGHQDGLTGIRLVRDTIEYIRDLDEEERPDVILVSNLIQGDFSHSKSKRRPVLVRGLDSNDAQFAEAKKLLVELKTLGIPVVHNLGPDDLTVAEDYTKDVVGEITGDVRSGSQLGHIPYYKQNQLTQSKLYQEYYRFQLDYALPLCYAMGRRLRSAREIENMTEGEVEKSEFRLLYEHIAMGAELPEYLDIDPDLLVKAGNRYEDGSCVTRNVDLVFHTRGGSHTVKYRHNLGLTAESLLANHMDTPLKQLGNLGMMGANLPDMLMTGRPQEFVYATSSNVPVASLPGLTNPSESLESDAYYSEAPGDASKRFNATRRRLVKPAIDVVEMRDNGNVVHHINTGKIMEKSRQIPKMALFEFCDFQTGSPTARQDYQIKYLSMVLDKAKEMPVAIHFTGDIIHGNIYANMAHEAQSIGLMRPESQMLALSTMLRNVFNEAPKDLIDEVFHVVVQQGNHDELQRVKSFGNGNNSPNIDYLIRDSKDLFPNAKVQHDAVLLTDGGTPVPTWRAYSHYGPTTVQSAHYHLSRGVKGNSGGLPVYHALQRAQGIGNAETPDIIIGAHWHNEQLAVIGDVVSVVGGAMAERSEFEDNLGYDAQVAGTIIEMGGGEPISVEFVHPRSLLEQRIKYGYFSPESLADHGFYDDPGYEPEKHAPFSYDYLPKSALHHAIRKINREASERIEYAADVRNPNQYGNKGEMVAMNEETRRLLEAAKRYAL